MITRTSKRKRSVIILYDGFLLEFAAGSRKLWNRKKAMDLNAEHYIIIKRTISGKLSLI